MKMIGIDEKCMGCGAKESDPECDCNWATCRSCGAWDCYIYDEFGNYHCRHCDHDTDKSKYDW